MIGIACLLLGFLAGLAHSEARTYVRKMKATAAVRVED